MALVPRTRAPLAPRVRAPRVLRAIRVNCVGRAALGTLAILATHFDRSVLLGGLEATRAQGRSSGLARGGIANDMTSANARPTVEKQRAAGLSASAPCAKGLRMTRRVRACAILKGRAIRVTWRIPTTRRQFRRWELCARHDLLVEPARGFGPAGIVCRKSPPGVSDGPGSGVVRRENPLGVWAGRRRAPNATCP